MLRDLFNRIHVHGIFFQKFFIQHQQISATIIEAISTPAFLQFTNNVENLGYTDQFANPASATQDFRTKSGSGFINAGFAFDATNTTTISGARTQGAAIDIGAWESIPAPASMLTITGAASGTIEYPVTLTISTAAPRLFGTVIAVTLGALAWFDGIFNALFAADLAKFVREGSTRGLFKDRAVVSLLSGEPEYLDPLKDEAPTGWLVTGYPWQTIATPQHKTFIDTYQKQYGTYPRLGSVVGYSAVMSMAAGIKKANSTDSEKLADAFKGLEVDTPMGRITYRAQDHQSTMGAYVGTLAVKDGKGVMENAVYKEGAKFLPSDAEVKAVRAAD